MGDVVLVKSVKVFLHSANGSGVIKIEAKEFDKLVGDTVLVKVYTL